jgi:ribose transport system ATP-binding protein
MTDGSMVLELQGIAKSFGGITALRGVDFALRKGEIHGLVGQNGAGKSTLMKIIAGVQSEYQGTMRIDGQVFRFRSAHDAIAAGIGMVHQELSIVPELSVAENLFLGRQLLNRFGAIDWRRMVAETERQMGGLGITVDPRMRIGRLPLGLQQLVELGRVLFSGARIIILDEPTSALSPPETARLFDVLGHLRKAGKSAIFISHFLDDVAAISDRFTIIREGRSIASADVGSVTKPWIIQQMIGSARGATLKADSDDVLLNARVGTLPVLEANGLIGDGLRGVSLAVAAGEVLGVYGFMGSGNSELGRLLVGKSSAVRRLVRVDGRHLRLPDTAAARRAGIVFLPESRRDMLFAAQPIYKNISIGILGRLSRILLRPALEREIAQKRSVELDVRPHAIERPVGTLSGGNQQKVALARWLTYLPKVLILNEPTRGMDIGAKQDVITIIRRIRDKGVAIIVSSTEPETILAVADRVVVFKKGRISREFSGEPVSKVDLLAAAA